MRKTKAERIAEADAAKCRLYKIEQCWNNIARLRQKLENDDLDYYDRIDFQDQYTEDCYAVEVFDRYCDEEGFCLGDKD